MRSQASGQDQARPAPHAPPVATRSEGVAADQGTAGLQRQLIRRMLLAGVMILALLALLAIMDVVNAPDESSSEAPRFTEPVPVRRREMVQPVKESPAVNEETLRAQLPAEPEESALPVDRSLSAESDSTPRAARGAQRPAAGVVDGRAETVSAPPVQRPAIGYSFETGDFADAGDAAQLVARLTAEGIAATVETRVRVGPFSTRAEAEAVRRRIKGLGVDAATPMRVSGKR